MKNGLTFAPSTLSLAVIINFVEVVKAGNTVLDLFLELVSKELNHLAAILHVYARGLIFMNKEKGNTFTLLTIFIVKSLQKEQNSTNLLEGVTKKSRLTFSSLAAPEATVVHP